jgi:hypothetical protein
MSSAGKRTITLRKDSQSPLAHLRGGCTGSIVSPGDFGFKEIPGACALVGTTAIFPVGQLMAVRVEKTTPDTPTFSQRLRFASMAFGQPNGCPP